MRASHLLVVILSTVLLTSCANPYKKYYTPVDAGSPGINYSSCAEPEILRLNDTPENIAKKMLTNNFVIIGYSEFNTANTSQADLLKQAKEVQACVVVVSKKFTHTENGYTPITQYHEGPQLNIQSNGVYGNRMYSGNTNAQWSGYTTTTYVPYQNRMYDYSTSFWAKGKPPVLGIRYNQIPDEEKLKLDIEKGVKIFAVITGSPADEAGFIAGDIIIGYNGGGFLSAEDFTKYLTDNYGKKVTISIRRLDKSLTKEVTLGNPAS